MPTTKRRVKIAAALPQSRLPIGTPTIPPEPSPSASSAFSQEADLNPSQTISRHSAASNMDRSRRPSTIKREHTLSPLAPSFDVVSIAEAKLQRQNKRIQDAEAALSAMPAPNATDNPRRKPRAWQKFELTHDAHAPVDLSDSNVAEVRINRFHANRSRDESITRSMSSVSHRTSDTGIGQDRHDSVPSTDDGFVVHTGRRRTKKVESTSFPEEPKLATVEASYDEREILKVFGVPLPGPGYIDQNIGDKNGVLQFVQHPNGDVSAHQWSSARFQWENIGQYSNIRKRVEGQLASDRLKGQTGVQTLQMQTLLYFRAVARQREASMLGLPFGAKEIEALLPSLSTRPKPQEASKDGVVADATVKPHVLPHSPSVKAASPVALPRKPRQTNVSILSRGEQSPSTTTRQPSAGTATSRFNFVALPQTPAASTTSHNPYPITADPFYPAALNYRDIYGTSVLSNSQSPKPPVYNSFGAITTARPGSEFGSARKPSAASSNLTPTHDPRARNFSPLVKDPGTFQEEMQRMTCQAEKRNSQTNLTSLQDEMMSNNDAGAQPTPATVLRPSGTVSTNTYTTPQRPQFSLGGFSFQTPRETSLDPSAPDFDIDPASPLQKYSQPIKPPQIKIKTAEEEWSDWMVNGETFRRQQRLYDDLRATDEIARPEKYTDGEKDAFDMTRMLLPVLESLASYTHGPTEKRRDYFSPWVQAPEYAIDHGPRGTQSSVDADLCASSFQASGYQTTGTPIGATPSKSTPNRPIERLRFGDFSQSVSPRPAGLEQRFNYGMS